MSERYPQPELLPDFAKEMHYLWYPEYDKWSMFSFEIKAGPTTEQVFNAYNTQTPITFALDEYDNAGDPPDDFSQSISVEADIISIHQVEDKWNGISSLCMLLAVRESSHFSKRLFISDYGDSLLKPNEGTGTVQIFIDNEDKIKALDELFTRHSGTYMEPLFF